MHVRVDPVAMVLSAKFPSVRSFFACLKIGAVPYIPRYAWPVASRLARGVFAELAKTVGDWFEHTATPMPSNIGLLSVCAAIIL